MLSNTYEKPLSGQYFQDFLTYAAGDYTFTKGTGGTVAQVVAAGSALGGWLNVPTAATANDYQSIALAGKVFEVPSQANLGLAKPKYVPKLTFEARLKITESASNSTSWYFGLTDTLTTGLLTSAGAPASSFNGAIFWKPKNTNQISFMVSQGTAQATFANIGTFVSGTSIVLTGVLDPGNGVQGWAQPQINGDGSTNLIPIKRQPFTLPLVPCYLSAGIVASVATAETLGLDYWGVDFTRV